MRTPPVLGDGQSGSKLLKAKKASIAVLAAVVAMLLLAMAGCKSIAPDAGHEIVLVEKPIFFGHGGINPEPVRAGRTPGRPGWWLTRARGPGGRRRRIFLGAVSIMIAWFAATRVAAAASR